MSELLGPISRIEEPSAKNHSANPSSVPALKRALDIVISLVGILLLSPGLLIVALAVKVTSKGPVIHWSRRVGRGNVMFGMPKFRSMKVDTPLVATHLLRDPDSCLTPIGSFLRSTSVDELPQLVSILRGYMSLVGPRAALFNQDDLIELRTRRGVHRLAPGLTGWAQMNGRDTLPISAKVELDHYYLENQSTSLDLKIVAMTLLKVLRRDGIAH